MSQLSLKGKRPKEKYHSYKGDVGKVADNVIDRDFSTKKPLEKWTTDVSQFNFPWGKCYISPILDMPTNEIVSYNLSLSPGMEQIKDMLKKAFKRFSSVQGLIMHSDQSWQYQHEFYRNELKKHGIIQSMSRKGNCYDNCIIETFFRRLKIRCSMDLRRTILPLMPSQKPLPIISTITTIIGFKLKQNGCLPLCSGKHPCLNLNYSLVSRKLGTYHTWGGFLSIVYFLRTGSLSRSFRRCYL